MLRRIPLFAFIVALAVTVGAQAPDGLMVRIDRRLTARTDILGHRPDEPGFQGPKRPT